MSTAEEKENFEIWLFEMDDHLENIAQTMGIDQDLKLDFSPQSLSRLENWILMNFTFEQMKHESTKNKLDVLARYVGETFRKELDGKWTIKLEDPSFVFYGMPIVVEKDSLAEITSPHSLITASLDRKIGNFMELILNNHIT